MKMKKLISAGLIGAMALSTLAFTGCGEIPLTAATIRCHGGLS